MKLSPCLLFLFVGILLISSCKKQIEASFIKLITPVGGSTIYPATNVHFKWHSYDSIKQKLFLIRSDGDVTSITTSSNEYSFDSLVMRENYKWFVENNWYVSDTATFTTFPDGLVVGTYLVTVRYSDVNSGTIFDTVYGTTHIKVVQTQEGTLRLIDDSIAKESFDADWGEIRNNGVAIEYGNIIGTNIYYDYSKKYMSAYNLQSSRFSRVGFYWDGYKVD